MSASFGKIIRRFYTASGLSKQESAPRIDVGISQLYVIMKGESNPSLLVAEQIAKSGSASRFGSFSASRA